jgi:5-methyltetrahydrofolate corrinoid/iron sulfur protein methyltransferase
MILIGERINGMFKVVKQAITDKNKQVIQDLAAKQVQAGATYLDVNVGTAAADQEGTMQWLIETIQETCSAGLSLDSQKQNVIAAGLKVVNADNAVIINSTPLNKKTDEDILEKYIEMAEQTGPKTSIIALTMDKNGVPQDMDMRVAIAAEIVQKAMEKTFDVQRLFIDPIILPVKVPNAQTQPGNILGAIEQIKYLSDPPPHMTIGLSNLSQGTLERSLINRIFLAMAVSRGLDSAIVDVLDSNLMDVLATSEMLMNKQIYSDSFLKTYATVGIISETPESESKEHALGTYQMRQIADEFNYKVICGDQALSNEIEHTVIAATEHKNLLQLIHDKTLIISALVEVD